MRRIIVATFVSLDGVMQAPGGPNEDTDGGFSLGGWTVPHWDEATGKTIDELFTKPFDLLLGRRTYDIFAAHWPRMPDDDPIAKAFNAVIKYVATHRPDTLEWRNSQALGDDAPAALREIKAGEGPDLLVQGSSDFLKTLFAHDLVDELRLMTFPVTLGGGKRLFGEGAIPAGFRLASCEASSTGVVMTTYERGGEVVTGSFALPEE